MLRYVPCNVSIILKKYQFLFNFFSCNGDPKILIFWSGSERTHDRRWCCGRRVFCHVFHGCGRLPSARSAGKPRMPPIAENPRSAPHSGRWFLARFAGVFRESGRGECGVDVYATTRSQPNRIGRPCPSWRSTIAQGRVGRHALPANNPPNRVGNRRFDWLSSSNNINKTGTLF